MLLPTVYTITYRAPFLLFYIQNCYINFKTQGCPLCWVLVCIRVCVLPTVYLLLEGNIPGSFIFLLLPECLAHNSYQQMFIEWNDSWNLAFLLFVELDKNRANYSQFWRGILMWTFRQWTKHNQLPNFTTRFKVAQ